MSKKILIFTILLSFIISLGLLTTIVYAYEIPVDRYPIIPADPETTIGEGSDFISLIRYFYVFGLSLIGVVAVGVLIYGGIMYMLAGTVTSTEDARKYIWGAVAGLVLAFGSYIILYTINPDLVNFQIDVKQITPPEDDGVGNNFLCGESPGWSRLDDRGDCPSNMIGVDNDCCQGPPDNVPGGRNTCCAHPSSD